VVEGIIYVGAAAYLWYSTDQVLSEGSDTPPSPEVKPTDIAGKTPGEIDAIAKDKGLVPKGPDPQEGKGSYVDPVTGKQRVLVHPDAKDPSKSHTHVNNPAGERQDIDGNTVAPESKDAHLPLGASAPASEPARQTRCDAPIGSIIPKC
jgi:hypothetical protein